VITEDYRDVGPDAVAFAPPPKVSRLAANNRLGSLLGSRKLTNPFVNAGGWLVIAAAGFVVLYLGDALVPPKMTDTVLPLILRFATYVCFVVGVAATGLAIRALVIGARAYFIYSNGFVYLHNGRAATFGWSEVIELKAVHITRGVVAGNLQVYRLSRTGGRPVGVPLNIVDGRDPFMDQLVAVMRGMGKPTP
jgi:hypothetical protein